MIKKLLFTVFLILILIGNCFPADPPSWDLLNEDCSDITDWTDMDEAQGVSEVSPAGQFRLYNTSAGNNTVAQRQRDIGTYPTDGFTVEALVYNDLVGTTTDNDYFQIWTTTTTLRARMVFASNGLFTHNGVSFAEIGTDVVDQ